MTTKNMDGIKDYLLECLFYLVISMIWYRNLLFRCLPGITYTESKIILWIMTVFSIILCTLVLNRYKWTSWTIAKALIVPFGIYTILTYAKIVGRWMTVVLICGISLAVALSIFVMTRKIKNNKNISVIIKHRMRHCCIKSQTILAIALMAIMSVIGFRGIFGDNILNASTHATSYNQSMAQTISNNIDTILLLQEDEWNNLSVKEKLNTLQTVANIEAHYLGLPNELHVGADNLSEGTLACYNDNTYTISIDIDHLEKSSVYDVLDSCCHEAYHSYQHRLVDAYNTSDEQLRELRIFKSAARYSQEFDDYADGENDYYTYYFQDCEMDARTYAEDAVEDYYSRIDEYLREASTN